MGMLLRAGATAGAAVLAAAPAQAAVQPAQAAERECATAAAAKDSTGAELWIEVCDPYAVRAGGEHLSPGDTIELREAGKGMILAEATVAEGEDSAVTDYWSGTVGYGEHPDHHVVSVDLGDGDGFIVWDH
ncbi:hypothetical protein O4J56_18085 [Nocardiopsis sp. RSe5-2]|uniref:Uncharacterized protein n=1 Tax=Nocardiopsis endophytica TaxID=3018445 RepID=A0ABT4U6J0_9ACTN|nr:hypothetical protein [Nocardiopsis endophytica]MDA2812559.1 hypothetical protein [Nocardiopsis endophytica]